MWNLQIWRANCNSLSPHFQMRIIYNHYVSSWGLGGELVSSFWKKFYQYNLWTTITQFPKTKEAFLSFIFGTQTSPSLYDELSILHDFSVLHFCFKFKYRFRIKLMVRMLLLIFHCFPPYFRDFQTSRTENKLRNHLSIYLSTSFLSNFDSTFYNEIVFSLNFSAVQ